MLAWPRSRVECERDNDFFLDAVCSNVTLSNRCAPQPGGTGREVVACAIDFRDRCGPQARYWCDNDDPECGSQQYGLARLTTNVCNQGHFRRHMLTASFTARDPKPTSDALNASRHDANGAFPFGSGA